MTGGVVSHTVAHLSSDLFLKVIERLIASKLSKGDECPADFDSECYFMGMKLIMNPILPDGYVLIKAIDNDLFMPWLSSVAESTMLYAHKRLNNEDREVEE